MLKKVITYIIFTFTITGLALAESDQIEEIKSRVEKLENQKPTFGMFSLSGLMEIEYSYYKSKGGNTKTKENDFNLTNVEILLEVQPHDYLYSFVNFQYENDDENVKVDEGGVLIGNTNKFPLYLKAGKFVVSFGKYDSTFVTDPLTLEIGEINEGALEIGGVYKGLKVSAFAFRADYSDSENDKDINYGFNVEIDFEDLLPENMAFAISSYFISSMAESAYFEDFADEYDIKHLKKYVKGAGVSSTIGAYSFTLNLEYIAALNKFDKNHYDTDNNLKPWALNIEAGYTFLYYKDLEMTIAAKYEKGKDLFPNDLKRYGGIIGAEIIKNKYVTASLNLEYLRIKTDILNDHNLKDDSVIAQLAVEF